jgi:hypothetical protein
MINLLPNALKTDYKYGRLNVALRRWVLICLIALIGLGGVATYGLVSLQRSTVNLNTQIAASQKLLANENYTTTQASVQDISNSFKLVVKVLSQEVLFSQLLKQVAADIPDNAELTGLVIGKTVGAIDITADAKDYTAATQVQVNLSDPANKIFAKADIVSINCASGKQATNTQFPCTVTVTALFAKNNPFLFINSQGTKSQ